MQALLKLSEFSYLLHTLSAKQVVGINNESVFPSDETAREVMLAQGFTDLQENGWLISQNGKYQTNAELMLLVAVLAAPENTIMLTRRVADETRQTVTYYQAQGIFVEQIYTSEKRYLLTRLDSLSEIVDRLSEAMSIPVQQSSGETAVSLKVESFERAMKQAQSGDLSALTTLLTANNLSENQAKQTAAQISRLQAAGNIEMASFSEERLQSLNTIIILKNETDMWAILPGDEPETIKLQTMALSSFSRMIQAIFNDQRMEVGK
jgi:hypothetical protein